MQNTNIKLSWKFWVVTPVLAVIVVAGIAGYFHWQHQRIVEQSKQEARNHDGLRSDNFVIGWLAHCQVKGYTMSHSDKVNYPGLNCATISQGPNSINIQFPRLTSDGWVIVKLFSFRKPTPTDPDNWQSIEIESYEW
jgi:hypothetical protein